MEKLDLGLAVEHQSNALLYIVCALGAKYVYPSPRGTLIELVQILRTGAL
jgi:hypothetical protein